MFEKKLICFVPGRFSFVGGIVAPWVKWERGAVDELVKFFLDVFGKVRRVGPSLVDVFESIFGRDHGHTKLYLYAYFPILIVTLGPIAATFVNNTSD